MRKLNERFAMVANINGVIDTKPGNGSLLEVRRMQQFRDFHDGQQKVSTGGGKTRGLGSAWIDHPQARRFERLGLWMPGKEPPGALNLFEGLPAKSIKGEIS